MVNHIFKADIDTLIKLRLGYISQEIIISDEEKERLTPHLTKYFEEHISNDSFTAYGYFLNDQIISSAFLITDKCPPGLNNLNGTFGIIMNVFTYPEHREKGYARAVMEYLIEDAKRKGIQVLDLYATENGKPLYEKLGFKIIDYTAMKLKI